MRKDGIEIEDGKIYLLKWNEEKKEYDRIFMANRFIANIYTTDGKYVGLMDKGRLIASNRIVSAKLDDNCNKCVTVIIESV